MFRLATLGIRNLFKPDFLTYANALLIHSFVLLGVNIVFFLDISYLLSPVSHLLSQKSYWATTPPTISLTICNPFFPWSTICKFAKGCCYSDKQIEYHAMISLTKLLRGTLHIFSCFYSGRGGGKV